MSNSQSALAELVVQRAALLRHRRKLLIELRANGHELAAVRNEMRAIFPRLRMLGGYAQPRFRHLIRQAIAAQPMLTTDLALMVMQRLGLDDGDRRLYLATRRRVHACLKELRRNGEVASERNGRQPNAWTLIRR